MELVWESGELRHIDTCQGMVGDMGGDSYTTL